jgi:peptide/nickel transport system substrate-binding protein
VRHGPGKRASAVALGTFQLAAKTALELLATCAIALMLPALAPAAELKVALSGEVTSLDPHFHNIQPNNIVALHLFDALVLPGTGDGQLRPGLAESWRALDDTTWEFRLRRGVKFHDGSELSSADVAFSLKRTETIANSPGPFVTFTKQITSIVVVDAHTIRLKTAAPYPLMPNDMSNIYIVPRRTASTADFDSGKAAIGTGPFRLLRYARGDRIELARNDAYWGGRAPWEKATLRIITSDPSRVAALLSAEVDAIENVPTSYLAKLKQNQSISLFRAVSNRVIFLFADYARDVSPFVTAKSGKPLERNPLKDLRVRRAISRAINRPGIVERVMDGEAVAAGQLLPDNYPEASPALKVEPFDPEGARKLLAEAGYPDGFGLTLHGPNNRYVNDEQVLQALAQMLARIGIATRVEAMPVNVFFSRQARLEFSASMMGWGGGIGTVATYLRPLLATYNPELGMGTNNYSRYSSARMDAVLMQALATIDDGRRGALLRQATEIAIGDLGIIPLYHQVNIWATRKGIAYSARADERTLATGFKPAP